MTLSKYIINGILLDTAIDIVNDNINDIVVLLTECEITRLVATIHFYRPQRSKVMFLHVSVILFTVSPSRGFSIPGGLCPWGGVSVMESPHTVMSGRYTSYWNAFLFICRLKPRRARICQMRFREILLDKYQKIHYKLSYAILFSSPALKLTAQ